MVIDNRKLYALRSTLFLAGAAVLLLVLYRILALPLYNFSETQELRYFYRQITELQLTDLDDEDEEILDAIRTNKIGVAIADESLELIYKTFDKNKPELMDKYFSEELDQFTEHATVEIKNYTSFEVIRLRGKVEQNGEIFYIFLRRELTGAESLIGCTCLYFAAAMLILVLLGWRLLSRGRFAAAERVPMRQEEQMNLETAQKEFVANVSHELKTPLTVISSQVEMLQKMGDEIDREYYYNSIREEIDKMSRMVGNLLDLTILEHRLEQMEVQEVDLSEMMEYLLLKYEALFQKKALKVTQELTEHCLVAGNRMYLEEAVNNYLMNAFQHTGEGKHLKVVLKKEKTAACIEVINQGKQIPEKDINRIWQSFYSNVTTGADTQTGQKNIGIGLFVVENIVRQHGGSCGAENMADGVRFWIRIPLM